MQRRKLIKGVGYSTIYLSDKEKYELSTNGTVLRRTFVKNDIQYEHLYEKVIDPLRIRAIEEKSMNWKAFGVNSGQDYYVIRQANADNKYNENIKIVKKIYASVRGIISHSVEARPEDFSYYVRRKG